MSRRDPYWLLLEKANGGERYSAQVFKFKILYINWKWEVTQKHIDFKIMNCEWRKNNKYKEHSQL